MNARLFFKEIRVDYSSHSGPPGIPPPGPPGPPLGALAVMTSSMRSIMHADSSADFMACSLTTVGSMTPLSMLFCTLPVKTFMPMYLPVSLSCADLSSASTSIGSSPAFSASARGIT